MAPGPCPVLAFSKSAWHLWVPWGRERAGAVWVAMGNWYSLVVPGTGLLGLGALAEGDRTQEQC